MEYDVIIIGAGPAGTSAAIYAARRALKTLVISKDLGGQTALALNIENYPGIKKIDGIDYMKETKGQAEEFGAEFIFETVTELKKEGDKFNLKTNGGKDYMAKAVILTFGRSPRKLNVSGETEFIGKGVAYCATCDAPLFTGKDVVVVGGGNSAVDAAVLLSKTSPKVYLVHRRDNFKAEKVLVKKMEESANIEQVLNTNVTEIKGDSFVSKVLVKAEGGDTREINAEGIFIEIGGDVNAEWLAGMVKLSEAGEIEIDKSNQTSVPGLFAAGDSTTVPYKQTIIAAGEGANAALAAYDHIQLLD
ncbi:MAG: FAD-dependent oxidoreductase [Patescibacteria group bacterium]|nr:FAD-dependent oxidoreductase [Patescibacteria group bacterium]